jgi:uncharacterized protein
MTNLASLRARLNQPKHNPSSLARQAPPEWPGMLREGARGRYFLIEERYPGTQLHGSRRLNDLLCLSPDPIALPELASTGTLDRLAFLDTETTGLAGGTGTLAFLIGIASFLDGEIRLRQYFLFDPSGEAQMLEDVLSEVLGSSALVTFNGRQFDVPVMQARTVLRLRRLRAFEGLSHLDLLPHARRLWRGRMESCALSALEPAILGVYRSEEDVPGMAIPALYREYLTSGDARPLERVLYHNRLDILSMVTLAAELIALYGLSADEIEDSGDALAMARAFQRQGAWDRAEALYRAALRGAIQSESAFSEFAHLLKKTGRIEDAVPLWEAWAACNANAWEPRIELAKHCEWRLRDVAQALRWVEAAEPLLPAGRDEQKRLNRLARKISRHVSPAATSGTSKSNLTD